MDTIDSTTYFDLISSLVETDLPSPLALPGAGLGLGGFAAEGDTTCKFEIAHAQLPSPPVSPGFTATLPDDLAKVLATSGSSSVEKMDSPNGFLSIDDMLTKSEQSRQDQDLFSMLLSPGTTALLHHESLSSSGATEADPSGQEDPYMAAIFSQASTADFGELIANLAPLPPTDATKRDESTDVIMNDSASVATSAKTKKQAASSSQVARSRPMTIAGIPAEEVDASRTWTTVLRDADSTIVSSAADVEVKAKTRRDEPSELLPDRLYSSLKYELFCKVPKALLKTAHHNAPFLHVRCIVLEADTLRKVEKTTKIKHVLKGVIEGAMTLSESDAAFVGQLKIQLDNHLSFHTENKTYCLELQFFLPDALNKPILSKRSPAFRAYARRPNKPRNSKRKQSSAGTEEDSDGEEQDEQDETVAAEPPAKKERTESPAPSSLASSDEQQHQVSTSKPTTPSASTDDTIEMFAHQLNVLIEMKDKLDAKDKKRAVDLVLGKFLELDPTLAQFMTTALVGDAEDPT